jgi:hypothetical protein
MIRHAIAGLWAAAILGTALASRSGAIELEVTEALILLLPILAAATLATGGCGKGARA